MLSFQIVVGSDKCNARCSFCVSKQTTTPKETKALCSPEINWRNFRKACLLAKSYGITSVVLTGKGEPTLYPTQITEYLEALHAHQCFPLIDLQTNGTLFHSSKLRSYLKEWYTLGLTTIALSVVSIHHEENQQVYFGNKQSYPNLMTTINILRSCGFMVRLSVVGINGYTDTIDKLIETMNFCKENDVKQLTWRAAYGAGVLDHRKVTTIMQYVKEYGYSLRELPEGGGVYDIDGQNVCIKFCLQPSENEHRNILFFPSGDVFYRWDLPGSIIMQGGQNGR